MEPRYFLIGTVALIGIAYHHIFLARPDDFYSLWQRIFPILYWSLVGVAIGRGVELVDKAQNNVNITISLAVGAVMVGIVVGHVIAIGLRNRVSHVGEDVYRELRKDEQSDRRRGNQSF